MQALADGHKQVVGHGEQQPAEADADCERVEDLQAFHGVSLSDVVVESGELEKRSCDERKSRLSSTAISSKSKHPLKPGYQARVAIELLE